MLRESLAQRFKYEGRIGHVSQFAVLSMFAAYFDESGNYPANPNRIAVAAAYATADAWLQFEQYWQAVLALAAEKKGFKGFHAKDNSRTQHVLNRVLPQVVHGANVFTYCITFDREEYNAATTHQQRSLLGNVYGFATYVCVSMIAEQFRHMTDDLTAGYYVEKGGPGSAKAMQILGDAYRYDDFRRQLRMGAYGPADRRIHLPVHPADLVAHEMVTNREKSEPLAMLGPRTLFTDVSKNKIREIMDEFQELMRQANHRKAKAKRERSRK